MIKNQYASKTNKYSYSVETDIHNNKRMLSSNDFTTIRSKNKCIFIYFNYMKQNNTKLK